RGNVVTRMQKLATKPEFDATILALAGLTRLHFVISPQGRLAGAAVPEGILATVLETDEMLPCVGQGAIGLEIRRDDGRMVSICEQLNHYNTLQCVTAERAFLARMGGGCQSPVAALAEVAGDKLRMTALSFASGPLKRAQAARPLKEAAELGQELAEQLKGE
ncbi:MAG: hydroxymethylbilane synthase, partial [Limisphaerales bacterium]